jgi:hypothetical protein
MASGRPRDVGAEEDEAAAVPAAGIKLVKSARFGREERTP